MEETKPIAKTFDGQMRGLAAGLLERVRQLNPQQRLRWGLLIALSAMLLGGLLWYGGRPDWRTLYAGLDAEDARTMGAQLTAAGIAFDLSPDGGTLKVPAAQINKARLAVTAAGGPRSGRMGFELFDKPNWVGSDFDEKVNYQRALEGELEQTIDTLGAVESARVHLVLPHDSLFTDQQRAAKASVVLKLRHRDLSGQEADAIRNLVAAAVDDLTPDNVVLVSSDGRGLFGKPSPDASELSHEQELTARLIETLEPVAGAGNVRASVNVDYDTSSSEETDESYDPANTATLSMQRSEQTSGGQPVAAGVPGTASNAPNVKPPLYPQQTSAQQDSKQESSTYGVSKKVRHTVAGAGRIRRITAAILINQQRVTEGRQVRWQPRPAAEMKQLTGLAEAAIGFDSSRGDLVTVEDLSFNQDQGAAPAGWRERLQAALPLAAPLEKPGAMLLAVLMLVLFVFRPLLKPLRAAGASPALPARAGVRVVAGDEPLPAGRLEEPAIEQQKLRAQAVFEKVAQHLDNEPAQSSRLLQSWIHSE